MLESPLLGLPLLGLPLVGSPLLGIPLLTLPDTLFWAILGFLMVLSSIREMKDPRPHDEGWSLPPDELASLWDDVASSQFPAMTLHPSPLVRAAGLSAYAGLTADALAGTSEANRRTLVDAPRATLANERAPAARSPR